MIFGLMGYSALVSQNVSLPVPPVKVLPPRPPKIVSSPAPPKIVSLRSAKIISLPSPPSKVLPPLPSEWSSSFPASPKSLSLV